MPTLNQACSMGLRALPRRTATIAKGNGLFDLYHTVYFMNRPPIQTLDKDVNMIPKRR